MNDRPRLKLRNLETSQKLLVLAVLATVGFGYLAALANLFAQTADGNPAATLKLEDIPQAVRKDGPAVTLVKIADSAGMKQVVRRYSGTPGANALSAALDTNMRAMIVAKLIKSEGDNPENRARAEQLRLMLAEWSKLPKADRERVYEQGCPVDERTGAAKFDAKAGEAVTIVKETLDAYCVRCHKPTGGAEEAAAGIPLTTFAEVDRYCVEDRGISPKRLALVTHVHLLGFAVLFGTTGLLFSMTDWPRWSRLAIAPFTLTAQLVEISCWWLAKLDPFFAKMIFLIGPLVGLGLLIQLAGTFLDLALRRPEPPTGGR